MNTSHENAELGDLLAELCEGTISQEQSLRLNDLLSAGADARAYYFDYLTVHSVLAWDFALGDDEPSHSLATPSPSRETFRVRFRNSQKLVLAAAVIVSAFWAGIALWVYPRWRGDRTVATPAETPDVRVATFSAGVDCRWDKSVPAPRPGDRIAGVTRLVSGLAQFNLASGVNVLVEGPAEVEFRGADRVNLKVGKLTAQVPQFAQGFTVATPTAEVVDLGTEFGVVASKTGKTVVQVFKGRVSVQPVAKLSGERVEAVILLAGQSNCVEATGDGGPLAVVPVSTPEQTFKRTLPTATPEKRSLPENLVAYWSFDEDHGPAWDERGRNHGVLEHVQRVPGVIGAGALKFTNKPGEAVRVPSRTSDLEFFDGISIEAVVISNWSGQKMDYDEILRKEDGNRLLLSFQHDDQQATAFPRVAAGPVLSFGIVIEGVYQELDMPLDGQEGRPTLAEIADGKPHHIVATYSGKNGVKAIYVDGKLRYQTQYPAGSKLASGGTQPTYIGAVDANETFTGTIDEVAIYNSALSPDEIAQHWKHLQMRQSYFQATDGRVDSQETK